jgi:hypothetical protein
MTPAATSARTRNRLQPPDRAIDLVELLAVELWGGCPCDATAGGFGVRIIVTDHDGADGRSLDAAGVSLLSEAEPVDPPAGALVSSS